MRPTRRAGEAPPELVGFHHVRLPVADVWASRDWYTSVLGFVSVLDLEEEAGPVGVVLRHPEGVVVGLHLDPGRAAALAGFAVLGLQVADHDGLLRWCDHLDGLGLAHAPIRQGQLGWYVDVPDPDGILVRLHSARTPEPEEA